ncbi:MAG: hypothetical protein WA496_04790 [Candidatus Udaeobacter sp.]
MDTNDEKLLFKDEVFQIVCDVRHSLSQRRAIGCPSPENVTAQIRRWRAKL